MIGRAPFRGRDGQVLGAATLCLLFVLSAGRAASAEPATYLVRPGDCLSEIAAEHDVTPEQLRRWNSLRSDVIQVGQRLLVGERGGASRGPATYLVVSGDTLGEIAQRFGVDVEELRRQNPGLGADHIEVGQRLVIPDGQPSRLVFHQVRRGETLADIARRYRVTLGELLAWNRDLRPLALSTRRTIRVREPEREPPSQSIGVPWAGRLVGGRRVEPNAAYDIRDRARAYGTEETVRELTAAFDEARRLHPRAPRVRIRDVSLPNGGAMDGHRSHRSGRDVDITYYQKTCPQGLCRLREVAPRELLPGPQWALLRALLRRGQVQFIFVDYELQRVLYREAQRQGATASQLSRWFQFPRGRTSPEGLIRHAPNHGNHAHVRFVCPQGDGQCQ